jgi:hypothetical protein
VTTGVLCVLGVLSEEALTRVGIIVLMFIGCRALREVRCVEIRQKRKTHPHIHSLGPTAIRPFFFLLHAAFFFLFFFVLGVVRVAVELDSLWCYSSSASELALPRAFVLPGKQDRRITHHTQGERSDPSHTSQRKPSNTQQHAQNTNTFILSLSLSLH